MTVSQLNQEALAPGLWAVRALQHEPDVSGQANSTPAGHLCALDNKMQMLLELSTRRHLSECVALMIRTTMMCLFHGSDPLKMSTC